jgi:acetylornithine/succinyldiaminopimelate/putrescine aminotransferase
MALNIESLLSEAQGQNYELHNEHINPAFTKVLRTIGFDRNYVRAEGQYLWDDKGNKYLDMLAGYGVFNVGRNNATIKQTLIDFLNSNYPSLVQLDAPLLSGLLAKELKNRLPCQLDYVYFTSSGSEGVETAIKFARCATGRAGIIHAEKSFHGLTTGSLAINGDDTFKEGFSPLMPDIHTVPFNDLAALEEALATNEIATFIVEPIQGKGVNIPDKGYLSDAARLCRKYKALFIVDEVQTGLGRTGKFLAVEHDEDVKPDMVILSKALSGGYVPVGAVITNKWIFNKVFSSLERSVVHSSTFGQGSLAMVAGLATLDYIDDKKLIENSSKMGNLIGSLLQGFSDQYEFIHDVRWRGLMIAIEFSEPKSFSLRAAWDLVHKLNKDLFPQAVTIPMLQDYQILTQVAGHHIDVIKLIPPLVIDEGDVNYFVNSFSKVMDNLHKFPGPVWEALSRIGKSTFSKNTTDEKLQCPSYQQENT